MYLLNITRSCKGGGDAHGEGGEGSWLGQPRCRCPKQARRLLSIMPSLALICSWFSFRGACVSGKEELGKNGPLFL